MVSLPFAHSPIARAEYLHQQRSLYIRRARRWQRPFIWLLRALAIFTAVFIIAFEGVNLLLGSDSSRLMQVSEPLAFALMYALPIIALLPFTLLLHVRLLIQVQSGASDAISREKRGGTWENLLLTQVDGHRIVLGKWWATLRSIFPAVWLLLLLRVGTVVWGALVAHRLSFNQQWQGATGQFEWVFRFNEYSAPQYPARILLAAALLLLLTLATFAFAAAGGVITSLLSRRSSIGLGLAIAGRALFLVGLAVGIVWASAWWMNHNYTSRSYADSNDYYDYYTSLEYNIVTALAYGGMSLVDNGTLLSMMTVRNDIPYDTSSYYSYYSSANYAYEFNRRVAALVISIGVYALLTWLMLLFGRWLALRQGALKPSP